MSIKKWDFRAALGNADNLVFDPGGGVFRAIHDFFFGLARHREREAALSAALESPATMIYPGLSSTGRASRFTISRMVFASTHGGTRAIRV